jgi:hypothetical protein
MFAVNSLVNVDDRDGDAVADATVEWLRGGLEKLAPHGWSWIRERERLPIPARPDDVYGPPGGYWGSAGVIHRESPGKMSHVPLYGDLEQWAREQVAARPLHMKVSLRRLNGRGRPYEDGNALILQVDRDERNIDRVQLVAFFSLDETDTAAGAAEAPLSSRLVDHVETVCGTVDVSFGHVTDDFDAPGWTSLDTVMRRSVARSVRDARQFLRGYSWVTVLPAELAARLGGHPALETSGAFSAVREYPSGAVLLRATEDIFAYGEDATREIFEVLRPVLPPGMPRENMKDRFTGKVRRLVWENAARDN